MYLFLKIELDKATKFQLKYRKSEANVHNDCDQIWSRTFDGPYIKKRTDLMHYIWFDVQYPLWCSFLVILPTYTYNSSLYLFFASITSTQPMN